MQIFLCKEDVKIEMFVPQNLFNKGVCPLFSNLRYCVLNIGVSLLVFTHKFK